MTSHSQMNLSPIVENSESIRITTEGKLELEVFEDYESENCGKALVNLKAVQKYFKDNVCIIYRVLSCFLTSYPSALLATHMPKQVDDKRAY